MAKTRNRKAFWDSTLQAPKVLAALESIGADTEAFERAYRATRKTRESRPLTERFSESELNHLRAFREHGDINRVARALDRSVNGAASLVSRAVAEGIL